MPDMLTTAGISFNGWNGYAEIYGNIIERFNRLQAGTASISRRLLLLK